MKTRSFALNTRFVPVALLRSLCAIGAMLCLLAGARHADAQAVVSTNQILNFRLIQGQPQWTDSILARIAGARWQFNRNGTFVYAPANARADLYPLTGRFQ